MNLVIMWVNKYSNERGYVEKISESKGCFYNTFAKESARVFRSEKEAMKAIDKLNEIGEGDNNIFQIEVL
ncbi:MAG: hypothetical protein Q4E57_03565 [Eubacteriales bacterium]|nr:hypothetical protein [Eubacteriales bacterium]